MIPVKIKLKVKSKCEDDKEMFNTLMDLLEYEDSGNGKQKIHCKDVVEKYAKEVKKNEN